jgi:hypothetical protein
MTISANRTEKRMRWAVDRFRKRVSFKLKTANKDKRLPLTTLPKNELEEIDLLAAQEQADQMWMSMPPDPQYEAQRQQAQERQARLIELRAKHAGGGDAYGQEVP